jgi:hypothetical protein
MTVDVSEIESTSVNKKLEGLFSWSSESTKIEHIYQILSNLDIPELRNLMKYFIDPGHEILRLIESIIHPCLAKSCLRMIIGIK